jgi:hypothetical protein
MPPTVVDPPEYWRGRKRGRIEVAPVEIDDALVLAGFAGDVDSATADRVLAEIEATYDVWRFGERALVGWFATGDIQTAMLRDQREILTDPYNGYRGEAEPGEPPPRWDRD